MRLSEKIKGYRAAQAKLEEFRAKDCAVTYAGAEGWTAQLERRAKLTAAIDRVICTLSYLTRSGTRSRRLSGSWSKSRD